ncbi:hypothetical protein BMF94_3829 [Rhodotorula taiwanensis]|uniref:Uncharacterized protein n=1 Tax=Rhodotorula taiwanensis TaxID=741276 RepID=A0A2S5B8N5_9BASI|nr:hypothetical protein BMF94_3829 [Rhodotorula taiwanensis]
MPGQGFIRFPASQFDFVAQAPPSTLSPLPPRPRYGLPDRPNTSALKRKVPLRELVACRKRPCERPHVDNPLPKKPLVSIPSQSASRDAFSHEREDGEIVESAHPVASNDPFSYRRYDGFPPLIRFAPPLAQVVSEPVRPTPLSRKSEASPPELPLPSSNDPVATEERPLASDPRGQPPKASKTAPALELYAWAGQPVPSARTGDRAAAARLSLIASSAAYDAGGIAQPTKVNHLSVESAETGSISEVSVEAPAEKPVKKRHKTRSARGVASRKLYLARRSEKQAGCERALEQVQQLVWSEADSRRFDEFIYSPAPWVVDPDATEASIQNTIGILKQRSTESMVVL